jgi:Carboxypeptidase regulatory-like domain
MKQNFIQSAYIYLVLCMIASCTSVKSTSFISSSADSKPIATYSIEGIVIGEKEQPLEFAIVELLRDGVRLAAGRTDSLGGFKIKFLQAGNYDLKVAYLGYKYFKEKISIKNNITAKRITLQLPSDSEKYAPIRIHGTPTILDFSHPGIQKLDQEQIKHLNHWVLY